jgi:hypothetical protein
VGGQDGSRGYLVQAIIALLDSLGDDGWDSVQIEAVQSSHKVDIEWKGRNGKRVVQVRSSINQIGKADAECWAVELRTATVADQYTLVLVGPCAQSVAAMHSYQGVSIPCPKSLDIEGLLHEAAHKLDKFLEREGLDRRGATQRELMVDALTTRLSAMSSRGTPFHRANLIAQLKEWISAFTGSATSPWEAVTFEEQRGLEAAVSGQRLGPLDVDACPEFAICEEIVSELNRSHLYQVMGTPGSGKSITAWHVARRLHRLGFSVWRPKPSASADDLMAYVPRSPRALLVVDDCHLFGRSLAIRMSERAGSNLKVLLISTVQEAFHSNIICLSPQRCVEQLAAVILSRRDEVLPIVRQHDDRVGDGYHDTSYEGRVQQARQQKKPWEFFWVLRGGWRTASREFENVKQFAHAAATLQLTAVFQIVSCDAGVPYERIVNEAQRAGIEPSSLSAAIRHLRALGLVIQDDLVRTKHINYAYRIVEESCRATNSKDWPVFSRLLLACVLAPGWTLKGIAWALDAILHTDALRCRKHTLFQPLVGALSQRCIREKEDIDWAAGCLSRLISAFDIPTEEILRHRSLLLEWTTSGGGLVAYFCGTIINELINRSQRAADKIAREFIDDVDAVRLTEVANSIAVDNLYTFGTLLDRLAYYGPTWTSEFFARFDWEHAKGVITAANTKRASAVDALITGISRLSRHESPAKATRYVEEAVPWVVRAINARPCEAVEDMHGIFWTCLGYRPRFLRGGWSPDEDQMRVAEQLVAGLEPERFARAMEGAIPRDLENLARTFEVIREIDTCFIGGVAGRISEDRFLAITKSEWTKPASELQNVIGFFAIGELCEPAATWIRKSKEHIIGALCALFAGIAPDVAIEFVTNGKTVEVVDSRSPRWELTAWVIWRLAQVDKAVCAEVVRGQLGALKQAIYELNLGSGRPIMRFLRVLFDLSGELFDQFVSTLDLNDAVAKRTIEQVATRQPKERVEYVKLARCGRRHNGRIAELSKELLHRLADPPCESP